MRVTRGPASHLGLGLKSHRPDHGARGRCPTVESGAAGCHQGVTWGALFRARGGPT